MFLNEFKKNQFFNKIDIFSFCNCLYCNPHETKMGLNTHLMVIRGGHASVLINGEISQSAERWA